MSDEIIRVRSQGTSLIWWLSELGSTTRSIYVSSSRRVPPSWEEVGYLSATRDPRDRCSGCKRYMFNTCMYKYLNRYSFVAHVISNEIGSTCMRYVRHCVKQVEGNGEERGRVETEGERNREVEVEVVR